MNNDIINYIVYFILISTTFGHISTKSYETLSLFIASFILVHKIYDNIVLSTVISISLSSFYKTFINKKEGMEDHHEIINQTRSQHLGISTNNNTTSDNNNTTSDNNNTTSDNNNTTSDNNNTTSDNNNTTSDNNNTTSDNNNTTSNANNASYISYRDMLEDSDESAASTYNTSTNVDDSSYSCKAHNNNSPAAVALCDAGHQKVSTDICSTGCRATQQMVYRDDATGIEQAFNVCCVGECGSCGTETITDNRGYTGGATSSYYTQSVDSDGELETTYISPDRWDLWAQQHRSNAALALQDISDNQDIFATTLEWDASANGIHSYLYNNEESTLPDDQTTSVPGTSATGEIIRISRFAKPDPCIDENTEDDFNPCNEDLESIANIRYRLGEYYYNNAPPDNYSDDNWKLASRQFYIVEQLVDFVLDNHSYNTTASFTGKRKKSGFSSNSKLRKRINNSKIKKETTTITQAIMSAWDAFKNEIKAN